MPGINDLKADDNYSLIKKLIKLPEDDFNDIVKPSLHIKYGMDMDFSSLDNFFAFTSAIRKIRSDIGDNEAVDAFLDSKTKDEKIQLQAEKIKSGFSKDFFDREKFNQLITNLDNRDDDLVADPINNLKQQERYPLIKDLISLSEENLNEVLKKEGLTHDDEDSIKLTSFKEAIRSIHDEVGSNKIDNYLVNNKDDVNIKRHVNTILDAIEEEHFNFDIVKNRVAISLSNNIEPSAPPLTAEEIWQQRLDKITSEDYKYFDPTLKSRLKEMESLAKGDDSHKQKAAKAFLDRSMELADNIESYDQTITERYQARIDKNNRRPMTAEGLFKFHNENNTADMKITEMFLNTQAMTAEAIMQGSTKLINLEDQDCDNLDIHKIIAPNVKSAELSDDLNNQEARQNKILAKRIFAQKGKSEQEVIDELLEARKQSGYKAKNIVTNKSSSDDLWKFHKDRKKDVLDILKQKHHDMVEKNFSITKVMMSARLRDKFYKAAQKEAYESLKKSDPDKVKDKTPEDINLNEMENVTLRGIQFQNDGMGNFNPNRNLPIEYAPGKTRLPNKHDMVKGMVRLLVLMQAEGNTKFRCRSSSPQAIQAFRAALKACNIPPEQASITQLSQRHKGESWSVDPKGYKGGLLHEAQLEYKIVRNEAMAEQIKILKAEQKQQMEQQKEEKIEQDESNAPRSQSM